MYNIFYGLLILKYFQNDLLYIFINALKKQNKENENEI